jgi:site-specific recombinase XerC
VGREPSPRTIEAYSLAVDQLGEYLKRLRTDSPATTADISRAHVEGFLVRRAEQGLAAATLNQRYRSLRRFFASW